MKPALADNLIYLTFIPDPESPVPDDYRIPIDYVNMFLTDDMLENLAVESNKYATEKTGSCPNFIKAEIRTYFGIYYMMVIVRLPKIDDYWRNDLRYAQFAEKMSRNRFRLIHRTSTLSTAKRLQMKPSLTGYGNYVHGLKNLTKTFQLLAAKNFNLFM